MAGTPAQYSGGKRSSDIRDRILKAFFGRKKIILTMGAHPIKVG
jgi:hypothetical protein